MHPLRVLVGCEFSQVVTKAFRARGHEAYSCDLLACEGGHPEWHYQCNVFDVIDPHWDLAIFHPPCTHLAVSGARYFAAKRADGRQQAALNFVQRLLNAPIKRIALENPVSVISTHIRKPDQIIQPWQFGHPHSKKTCLWLKNLPLLKPTKILEARSWTVNLSAKGKRTDQAHNRPLVRWENQSPCGANNLPPSKERWKLRSITYEGIAEAIVDQWSHAIIAQHTEAG